MMKKIIIWILLLVILACGCSETRNEKEIAEEVNQEETKKEKKREGLRIIYEICDAEFTKDQIEDCICKLRMRVENSGQIESEVYIEGNNRIIVDMPGVIEVEPELKELGRKGDFFYVLGTNNIEPVGQDEETDRYRYVLSKSLDEIKSANDIILDGSDIQSAEAGSYNDFGQNQYTVSMTFNDSGRVKFAKATTDHVGEIIAIIYDGEIICAPMILEPLTEGMAQISGGFTAEEAENIATSIRIGALPFELREISCEVVKMK